MNRPIQIVLCIIFGQLLIASAFGQTQVSPQEERLNSFHSICSDPRSTHSRYYSSVNQQGDTITFTVKDSWNGLSRDGREGRVKQWFTLWSGMGGARGFREKPSDFKIKIKHQDSGRVIATWDSLLCYKEN